MPHGRESAGSSKRRSRSTSPLAPSVTLWTLGYGGSTAAAFPWLKHCTKLFYWGDIDAPGFEILNGFREAGLAVSSQLRG
jgi:hypothetical protein